MSILIIDRTGELTDALRDVAQRRLHFALSRFDSRVDSVTLIVEDQNGPRGGIDKACRLVIALRHLNEVIVNDCDADVAVCISRVAQRAGRAVSRSIDRSRRFTRESASYSEPTETT